MTGGTNKIVPPVFYLYGIKNNSYYYSDSASNISNLKFFPSHTP